MRFLPDKFICLLLAAIAVATVLPIDGEAAYWFGIATKLAIALLFFLHGARLSRQAVIEGITHWRLHLVVLAISFVLFPLLGLLLGQVIPGLSASPFYAGLLFLCILPSTVQSSIAFTSIAKGNVSAAIVAASASNIIGMFLTPLLVGLLFTSQGQVVLSLDAFYSILLQLLAPFVLGQLLQPYIGGFIRRHNKVLSLVDRGSIVMVVYLAFSTAMVQGLWSMVSRQDLITLLAINIALLGFILWFTGFIAKQLGFSRADQITIVFCGSKKSLASGAPMASVIFPAAMVGSVVLPLMIFHQIQLMACAFLARRYAAEQRDQ